MKIRRFYLCNFYSAVCLALLNLKKTTPLSSSIRHFHGSKSFPFALLPHTALCCWNFCVADTIGRRTIASRNSKKIITLLLFARFTSAKKVFRGRSLEEKLSAIFVEWLLNSKNRLRNTSVEKQNTAEWIMGDIRVEQD